MAGFGQNFIPMEFGNGITKEMGRILTERKHKKILAVYDKGIKAAGITGPILDSIKAAGIEVAVYEDVVNDPPASMIDKAGVFAKTQNVDGIVAIGGGSSLDSAKAINMLINNEPPISQYFGPGGFGTKDGVPLYTIPTTAGTGAEVTFIGILTDDATNLKKAVIGPSTFPKLAIIDPLLMVGLPAKITAPTGADAFSHSLEAVCNINMNPVSDLLGYDAISRITKWLPVACADPMNVQAREELAYASTFAGIAFINTGCNLGHAIGHNVGTFWHVAHGAACGAALPEVARWYGNGPRKEKIKLLIEAMGKTVPEGADIGDLASRTIRELFDSVGVVGLKSLNIKEDELDKLADYALADGVMNSVPFPRPDKAQMLEILKRAYI